MWNQGFISAFFCTCQLLPHAFGANAKPCSPDPLPALYLIHEQVTLTSKQWIQHNWLDCTTARAVVSAGLIFLSCILWLLLVNYRELASNLMFLNTNVNFSILPIIIRQDIWKAYHECQFLKVLSHILQWTFNVLLVRRKCKFWALGED